MCIAGGGDPLVQLAGIVSIGAFVFGVSLFVRRVIDRIAGARISSNVETPGQDSSELGIEFFPEFVVVVKRRNR